MRPHQLLQSRRHRERLYHAAVVSAGALYRLPCDAHEAHSRPQAACCEALRFSSWFGPALKVPWKPSVSVLASSLQRKSLVSERGTGSL